MAKIKTINVKGTEIILFNKGNDEFISITDIARFKNATEPRDVVKNWMRSKSTIEFLGLWERINNPNFKGVEFDAFMFEAGSNSFVLSPSKWIESTNAIGIINYQIHTDAIKEHIIPISITKEHTAQIYAAS
jgi:hypothetical protein